MQWICDMTFVAGFYSFNLGIVDPAHDRYETVRIKLPLHPEESPAFLHARVLSFAHAYKPGLEFSPGFFEPKLPTMWSKDLFEAVTTWIQVGVPEKEKIQRALRHHKEAEFKVYFLSQAEIDRFCHYLRGSTTNWAAKVSCFHVPQDFAAASAELLQSSSTWQLTFADDSVFLTINGVEFETSIQSVDIWDRFQHTIQNT